MWPLVESDRECFLTAFQFNVQVGCLYQVNDTCDIWGETIVDCHPQYWAKLQFSEKNLNIIMKPNLVISCKTTMQTRFIA